MFQFNIVFSILVAFVSNYFLEGIPNDWRWMLAAEAMTAARWPTFVGLWLIDRVGSVIHEGRSTPNARRSLDRRQAVDATSTATSGKLGRKTAGGLTKDKSFGHKSSGGRT